MTPVLTREHALLIALGSAEAREEFAERIRAQISAWAREAAPLEPFPCGYFFQELRALTNAVEAELHGDAEIVSGTRGGWTVHRPSRRRNRPKLSPSRRRRILERDRYTCQECGFNPATPQRNVLTIDHIIPRCEGGGSNDANLQVLCLRCNAEKGRSLPELAVA